MHQPCSCGGVFNRIEMREKERERLYTRQEVG